MKRNAKIVVILISLPFFVLVVLKTHSVSAQSKPETAGEKFKNITVLNDMPADQLGKVMNIFSASLGKNCSFCHVEDKFDLDEKKEKATAREMIKMTVELNKEHFRGRPEISCNTCHGGKERPQSLPGLAPVAAEARPKQPESRPTADQIIDKYLKALGGTAKLARVTSRYVKAQRIEPDGKSVEPEEIWFKTGKYRALTAYGKYMVREEFDGSAARKYGNTDEITLKRDEAEQIRREAELFSPATIRAIYPRIEFRSVEKIDGREVNMVFATTAGGVRERLAFDAKTGLLVRRSASTPTIFGNFVYQVDYLDYKNFGGVRIPTTIQYAMPNIRWTRKVTSVETNVPIGDAIFSSKAQ